MQIYTLTLPGTLPGLNEYIKTERANKHAAAQLKSATQAAIRYEIRRQLRGIKFKTPVHITYLWFEKNKKRDMDNVAFAKKFIQDSLVNEKLLVNDGWADIAGFIDRFYVDAKNPRVEVIIKEV